MSKAYSRILAISDMHCPFEHKDTVRFLRAIKKEYKPDLVICGGDEADNQALSYHESNADLPSAGDELKQAKEHLKKIYELFPVVKVLESNHSSLFYRKAFSSQLPKNVIKSYRDIFDAPKGWSWHNELIVKCSNGSDFYTCHGRVRDVLKLSQSMGMSALEFHFHEALEVRYWGNSKGLYWAAIAGCLINNNHPAFNYNKLNLKRPVIGCIIILDGLPKLLPMVLNKKGDWIGVVP